MAHLASIHPCMQSLRKEPPPPLQSNPPKFPFHLIPHSTSKASSSASTASPPLYIFIPILIQTSLYASDNTSSASSLPRPPSIVRINVFDAGWAQAAAEGEFLMEKCQGFCGTERVKGGWDSKRDFGHNFCSTQYAHNESPAACASQAQSQTADANDYVALQECIVHSWGVVPSWDSWTSTSSSRVPFTPATVCRVRLRPPPPRRAEL